MRSPFQIYFMVCDRWAKSCFILVLFISCLNLLWATPAYCLEHIIRPYQGIRSSAMGGVLVSTGLYDENFFGNPARVAANPSNRFTIFDPFLETTPKTIQHGGDLTGGGDKIQNVADTAGDNLHARIQTAFPAYYHPNPDGKYAWALGLITSSQVDLALRRSYQLDPVSLVDIGPAFSIARRFLEDRSLVIGMNAHFTYRASTKNNFNLADFIKGGSFSPSKTGNDGAHIEADLGATYDFTHWKPAGFQISTALSINHLLGGRYKNAKLHFLKAGTTPREQPREMGFGASARKESLWVFSDFVGALEFQNIGNNKNGSIFRTIHTGAEVKWRRLRPRLGLYQGYPSAGLGIDLYLLDIDVATYGEEMSLNTGGKEDRRIALKLTFSI